MNHDYSYQLPRNDRVKKSKRYSEMTLEWRYLKTNSSTKCQIESQKYKWYIKFSSKIYLINIYKKIDDDHPKNSTYSRTLIWWIFIVFWQSEWVCNVRMNPEFITLINSVMKSGFILTFRARSNCRETMKIRHIRVLTYSLKNNWI